jgi:anti-sigma factor RsiW
MMRDCEDGAMRDLLPGYVHGTISQAERATVDAHLDTCEDCAAEMNLIVSASKAFPAPKMNISGIVKALPAAPRAARRPFYANRFAQLAAAIGIVAIGALSVVALRGFFGGDTIAIETGSRTVAKLNAVKPAPVALPDTAALAAATPPQAAPISTPAASSSRRGAGITFGGGLSDLSDDQLAALLSELDTLDALPTAEPESHLSPIVPEADGGHNAN